jgi:hypothetical protein
VPIREVVSQISPPIRILLVLAVAVLGVYMLFLRPKPEEVPPLEPATDSTSVSKPGKVRDAAEDAVDAANGQLAQQESVDGVDAGEAAAGSQSTTRQGSVTEPGGAVATPAEDLKGLPKDVRAAIRNDKVLVLLFWNQKSSDDRVVRQAVDEIGTRDGRVFVKVTPLKSISKYGRITRGASVEQSPTIVVADRNLRAETLVGYVDRTTISQAVTDALKNTDGLFTDSYLRAVDKVCVRYGNHWHSVPWYYPGTRSQADRRMERLDTLWAGFLADLEAIDAPKKWRGFHKATLADMKAYGAMIHKASVATGPKLTVAANVKTVHGLEADAKPIATRANKRFAAEHLLRCGSQF